MFLFRLIGNAEDNFDIVKLSLNLETKTDSQAIEDMDILISKQLRLNNDVSDALDSLETFVESSKYETAVLECDLEFKRNLQIRKHPSKIPLLNTYSNSGSFHQKTPSKSEIVDNIKENNPAAINGYELVQQGLIFTEIDSDLKVDQLLFNEKETCKENTSVENILDFSIEVKNAELDILNNMDSIASSMERRLTIKHSISEESEPEKLESIDECTNSLENVKSKDVVNHTHTNDFIKESEINKSTSVVSDPKLNYSKEKLLAAMKAIDDNENIEFLDHGSRKNSITNRSQITENLYRGLPTHSRKKEIIRDLFEDGKVEKSKGGCSKLH